MAGIAATVRSSPADAAAERRRSDLAALARGGALNLVGTIANGVFSFALGIVVTRALHARGAGLFFEALGLFTVATTVTQFGAEVGVVRNVPRYRALGRDADARACLPIALLPVLCGSSVAGALLFAFAPQISHLVVHGAGRDALVPYLHVLAPFLPLAAASRVLLAATRGYGTMVPFITTEYLGKAGLRPLLALAAVAGGFGAVGMALSWSIPVALGFVAAVVWLVVLVRRAQPEPGVEARPRGPIAVLARDFWRFTVFRGVSAVFDVAVLWLDVLLVGALGSARQAGIYAAASRVLAVGAFALQAVFLVIGPQISALLAQKSRERALALYQTSTAWLTAIGFPVYLTMAVFA